MIPLAEPEVSCTHQDIPERPVSSGRYRIQWIPGSSTGILCRSFSLGSIMKHLICRSTYQTLINCSDGHARACILPSRSQASTAYWFGSIDRSVARLFSIWRGSVRWTRAGGRQVTRKNQLWNRNTRRTCDKARHLALSAISLDHNLATTLHLPPHTYKGVLYLGRRRTSRNIQPGSSSSTPRPPRTSDRYGDECIGRYGSLSLLSGSSLSRTTGRRGSLGGLAPMSAFATLVFAPCGGSSSRLASSPSPLIA